MKTPLDRYLDELPLVAILRGVTPDDVLDIAQVLFDSGFRCIEVPLNSPRPLESIFRLVEGYGEQVLVGGGTVLDAAAVDDVADAGGRLLVTPHFDEAVVRQGVSRGMYCVPGVATPSEAFAALRAGAQALKMFPAEALPPAVLRAWTSVLPHGVSVFPVGGITPERVADYLAAGARGFGLGSALYRPGMTPADVATRAQAFRNAVRSARPPAGATPPA